jgi:hypothetical protein
LWVFGCLDSKGVVRWGGIEGLDRNS